MDQPKPPNTPVKYVSFIIDHVRNGRCEQVGRRKQEVSTGTFSSAPVHAVNRQEAELQITNMKLLHDEGQRLLLLQQRGFWEKQLSQSEQEKLRCEKRVGEELDRISSEKKRMEEEHEEEVSRLREVLQTSQLTISQSESSLEEAKERLLLVEDELTASQRRCSELEARLTEACLQLEESITFLESQELLNQRLTSQKSSMEAELQLLQTQEEQLVLQVAQLKEELGSVQAASDSLLQDREVVVHSCGRLSDDFALQQAQLHAREQTVDALRAELEALQEAARSRAAELDSLRTDRERLIQDLKEQAMAVDTLQLELDAVSEEANRRRSAEEALKEEQSRSSQLQVCLDEEKEEACRLSQERESYSRLADQLSTQIVEMEEEISSLRNHLKEVSSQLNGTADLVLHLRRQLNSRSSEVERLHASSQELLRNLQQVSGRLEKKDGELDRTRLQLLQLQETLLDSQNRLRSAEQGSEEEKRRMTRQLMELETLVLALEEETHPGGPHRLVEYEADQRRDLVQDLV